MECFGRGLSATVERVSEWCISERYPGAMSTKWGLGSREITVLFTWATMNEMAKILVVEIPKVRILSLESFASQSGSNTVLLTRQESPCLQMTRSLISCEVTTVEKPTDGYYAVRAYSLTPYVTGKWRPFGEEDHSRINLGSFR